MASQKKTVIVALTIAAIMMMASVLALLTQTKTIPSSGTINPFKVGVYHNSGCTDVLNKINWTNVNPGYSTTETIYVKNGANVNMILSWTVTDFATDLSPANSTNVVTLTWNATGITLTPGSYTRADVILSAADNTETQKGFNITTMNINIIGTET
jgi:archaellum component FlaG (FlaF/FlaG flagellin family)